MQNNTITSTNTSDGQSNNGVAPSVPISLYREVTAELQSAKAIIDSLTHENQQLNQENQELQQNLQAVINSSLILQQTIQSLHKDKGNSNIPVISNYANANAPATPHPNHPIINQVTAPISAPEVEPEIDENPWAFMPNVEKPKSPVPTISAPLFQEDYELPYPSNAASGKKGLDLGNLWLIVAICLIVFVAFGAGYFVVRPLLIKK